MSLPRLHLEQTALLVLDLQERLLPHIHNAEQVTRRSGLLIDAFRALGRPIVVTEQYPHGLGHTVPEIAGKLGAEPGVIEKTLFSGLVDQTRSQLAAAEGVRNVVVCGIEAHVCVLQTCLDLLESGYVTAIALDAIGSRRQPDHQAGERRILAAGATPTSAESAIFEMVREAGTDAFKAILPLVR